MQDYAIQQLSSTNLPCLAVLYKDVFHKHVSSEYLRKKYDTKAFGTGYIGYLAMTTAGVPVAYYGVIPCFVRIGGEKILAAQSADTMTHPDHQKRGLFLRLAEMTYALARQKNIEFIFGFPNPNSYPGFVKLKWQFAPEPMKLFTFRGSRFPYGRVVNKFPLLSNLQHGIISLMSGKKSCTKIFPERERNGILHDSAFMNYKTYSRTFFINFENTCCWVKADGILKIGQAVWPQGRTGDWLMRHLRKKAILLGCSQIIFITSHGSDLYRLLSPLRDPQDALPIGFYNLGNRTIDFTSINFEYCDIDIF